MDAAKIINNLKINLTEIFGIIIDDTSLCFNTFGGLPGPYIKYFFKKLGPYGLFKILNGYENKSASAICTIGFLKYGLNNINDVKLFQGFFCLNFFLFKYKNIISILINNINFGIKSNFNNIKYIIMLKILNLGSINGSIVEPRGSLNFGWDSCFKPVGKVQTLGEINIFEKSLFSHRNIAFSKLKFYLNSLID